MLKLDVDHDTFNHLFNKTLISLQKEEFNISCDFDNLTWIKVCISW